MFNPERLLGGLMRSGMRRRSGLGSLLSGGAALGLVGVAMEAVEHFMNQGQTASPSGSIPGTGGTGPPPPPPTASTSGGPPGPPPGTDATPPPPPGVDEPSMARQNDAVLLIQAMIAAANADGTIDDQERSQILDKLTSVSISEEDRQFIRHELLSPKGVEAIAGAVRSNQMAHQVYYVSHMAVEVDTDAERCYLQQLAKQIGLRPEQVEKIHQQLGVSIDFDQSKIS